MNEFKIHFSKLFLYIMLLPILLLALSFTSKADEAEPNAYYYSQLSDESKMIYDALLINADHTKKGNYNIKIEGFTKEQIKKLKANGVNIVQSAVDAFDRDHPEVFWLNVSKLRFVTNINGYITISPSADSYLIDEYANEEDPEEAINNDITLIEENILYMRKKADEESMDDEDKYKLIHDFIVINNDYNSNIENASGKAYKAVSAALGNINNEDSPVCEGYARAFKLYCDRLDLNCVIISGTVINNEDIINHMWNYIKCNGSWYAVDVTWDDPVYTDIQHDNTDISYEYFCTGYESFFMEHIEDNVFTATEGYDYTFDYPLLYPYNIGNIKKAYKITIAKYSSALIVCDVYNPDQVPSGTRVNISVTLNENKKLIENSLKVNGLSVEDFSFIMPKSNVTITAAFINDVEIPDENEISKPDKELPHDDNTGKKETESSDNTLKPDKTGKNDNNSEGNNHSTGNTVVPEVTKKPSAGSSSKPTQKTKASVKTANTVTSVKPASTPIPVIVQEEDFPEEDLEYHGIFAIKNADIVISNEMVYYRFPDVLKNKDIKISISNSSTDTDRLSDIINKKYNIHEGSEIETLKISLFEYTTGKVVWELDEKNKAVIYIPVDFSWLNADYATAFYQIKDGEAVRKLINVRESRGKYYLQVSMSEGMAVYAITRYKPDYSNVITSNQILQTANTNLLESDEDKPDVLLFITMIFIVFLIGVSAILLQKQHKLNKIEKRNQNNLLA